MGEQVMTLTNRKLASAIPIFAVRRCINPSSAMNKFYAYASHDFEMKSEHAQIDLPTGIVTIQTSGIWQFNFSANCDNVSTHQVELRVDGVAKASSYNYFSAGSSGNGYYPIVISALLELNAAQKVGIFSVDGKLYEDRPAVTTRFSGTMYTDQ